MSLNFPSQIGEPKMQDIAHKQGLKSPSATASQTTNPPATHDWLVKRIHAFLAMFPSRDHDPKTWAAVLHQWAEILDGLTEDEVNRAIRWHHFDGLGAPKPGEFRRLCQRTRSVIEYQRRQSNSSAGLRSTDQSRSVDRGPRVTAEQAQRILDEAGFTPERMAAVGSGEANVLKANTA